MPVAEVAPPLGVTPRRFEAQYVVQGRPMVFRRLVADWPALDWDPDRIAGRWPKRAVLAQTAADGLTVRQVHLTPEEMVRRLADNGTASTEDPDWYFNVLEDLPELVADLPPPRVYRGRPVYLLYMGRNTQTPAHYHEHALICQIHGRKRVLIYPPEDTPRLYPRAFYSGSHWVSRVDIFAPDFVKFPKLADARPMETFLEPGDAVFIPIHWWHGVTGIGTTVSVSLFWDARWREHRFPQPGLRNLAAKVFQATRRRLRRVGS